MANRLMYLESMFNIVDKVRKKNLFSPFRVYFFGGTRDYISMNFLTYFATVASLNNENKEKYVNIFL